MIVLLLLLIVAGINIQWNEAIEGTYYYHRYNATTPRYKESSCHREMVNIYNDTSLGSTFSYKLANGERVNITRTALVTVEELLTATEIKVQENENGKLTTCNVKEVKFGKSFQTGRMTSGCFFESVCGSFGRVPTAVEIEELNELCPQPAFKIISQENC